MLYTDEFANVVCKYWENRGYKLQETATVFLNDSFKAECSIIDLKNGLLLSQRKQCSPNIIFLNFHILLCEYKINCFEQNILKCDLVVKFALESEVKTVCFHIHIE